MSDERWRSHVRGLLRGTDRRLLVLRSEAGWALPCVEVEGYADFELERVGDGLAETVGAGVIVVRALTRNVDEAHRTLEVAFELEALDSVELSENRWVEPAELADLDLPTRDRALVRQLLDDNPPPKRPPWARPGWVAEATEWIENALASHGRRLTGPVAQRSNWCISSILRAPTAEGDVYLKSAARLPLFVDEGAVMRGLAAIFPEAVPSPLAFDSERRWMLLDDFGPKVGWKASPETSVAVLSLFGRLQVSSSTRVEELEALGVIDRRPAWLAREGAALLTDPDATGELEDEEIERLSELAPTLVESCSRLAAGPVPDTIVHGDLHLDNVAGADGRYVFFDWTDASVTHPFLDLLVVLLEEDADLRRRLSDAYLSTWAEFAPEDDLHELWTLAEPLASLNQALSYRSILTSIEPGTELDLKPMLPYFLRKILATVEV
jgi:Phosphotransferase enzyme family